MGDSNDIDTAGSLPGSKFGRVQANRMTLNAPDSPNSIPANAVAPNGTEAFGLENEVHRTTAMGMTCRVHQQQMYHLNGFGLTVTK